ncbi:hypothetical protein DSO57_1000861 [Entomophthora muscae]|uniref:Uncharacterized protein n=1 Tax=Entomophthora muscae TaxID=34485 RepID=A0ACC2U882_9FUNG|nr:hypothetical protein DSO57_1000861 [Entomophthora muscae]
MPKFNISEHLMAQTPIFQLETTWEAQYSAILFYYSHLVLIPSKHLARCDMRLYAFPKIIGGGFTKDKNIAEVYPHIPVKPVYRPGLPFGLAVCQERCHGFISRFQLF